MAVREQYGVRRVRACCEACGTWPANIYAVITADRCYGYLWACPQHDCQQVAEAQHHLELSARPAGGGKGLEVFFRENDPRVRFTTSPRDTSAEIVAHIRAQMRGVTASVQDGQIVLHPTPVGILVDTVVGELKDGAVQGM